MGKLRGQKRFGTSFPGVSSGLGLGLVFARVVPVAEPEAADTNLGQKIGRVQGLGIAQDPPVGPLLEPVHEPERHHRGCAAASAGRSGLHRMVGKRLFFSGDPWRVPSPN